VTELLENIAQAARDVAHQQARRSATDEAVRKPSGFSDERSDRKASPGSPVPARVTAVGIAKHLSRRHWPGSDDTLLAIHRTFLSRNGGGKAPVDPAWAVLSTSGLRALKLPVDVRDVIVLADGDDPGEAAARDCAWRWKREGRRVRIARPPKGMEITDLPVGGAPSPMRGAR
jgi:hypothetical protein